jgi:hypothetical protein
MARELFRKTEAGLAALKDRAALEPRLRTMLILINGRFTVEELQAQLGVDPIDTLRVLVARGLIERVPGPKPAGESPPPPPPPVAPTPATAPAPADASAAPSAALQALRAAQLRALDLLERYFGPGGREMAMPLLQAKDAAGFNAALASAQERLAIYQGKKRAAEVVNSLRMPG